MGGKAIERLLLSKDPSSVVVARRVGVGAEATLLPSAIGIAGVETDGSLET